jgi:hypothetical protein
MPELSFTLRLARPSELSQLIDIDDQASVLYAQVGLTLALADDHPFVQAEAARWARAIDADSAHVALAPNGEHDTRLGRWGSLSRPAGGAPAGHASRH